MSRTSTVAIGPIGFSSRPRRAARQVPLTLSS
jgi:hypothetical protein